MGDDHVVQQKRIGDQLIVIRYDIFAIYAKIIMLKRFAIVVVIM